jgi:hypothetical protein
MLPKVPPRKIWAQTPRLISVKVKLRVEFSWTISLPVGSRLVHVGFQLARRRVAEVPLHIGF